MAIWSGPASFFKVLFFGHLREHMGRIYLRLRRLEQRRAFHFNGFQWISCSTEHTECPVQTAFVALVVLVPLVVWVPLVTLVMLAAASASSSWPLDNLGPPWTTSENVGERWRTIQLLGQRHGPVAVLGAPHALKAAKPSIAQAFCKSLGQLSDLVNENVTKTTCDMIQQRSSTH